MRAGINAQWKFMKGNTFKRCHCRMTKCLHYHRHFSRVKRAQNDAKGNFYLKPGRGMKCDYAKHYLLIFERFQRELFQQHVGCTYNFNLKMSPTHYA
jgi:hypothetical protein